MIGPVSRASAASAGPLSPERLELREAAEAFEAIMLRQWLASARAGSMAEQVSLTGGGRGQFETMRDEQFAELASKSGTLGLAASIEAQLSQHLQSKDV